MPADRRGPHLREISREALTEEGGPLGQSGTATCGRASEGTPLSAAVRGLLLLLTAVRSGEGLIAAGSRNGGGCSMLSIGRRSGAAALQWSLSPPGGAMRAARHAAFLTPRQVLPRSSVSEGWGFTPATNGDSRCCGLGAGRRSFSPLSMAGPAQKKKPNPAAKTPRAAKISSAATRKNAGAATATKKTTPGGKKGPKSVLVIVESPAKARTITALLKKASGAAGGGLYDGYTVDACNGHVTDLVGKRKDVPLELKEKTKGWDVVGVDVENGFEPLYIQNVKKKPIINRLKKASAKCDEIILATDEDREGEAISWHLLQVLEPKVPVKRAVFHEITQEALVKAFEEPGEIDNHLVQAQEARRILDRLAGFTLTPVIWKFVAPGLSAGRVQSVALSMVVERERARLKFKSAEYWDVVANVTAAGEPARPFEARLVQVGSKAVVSGKDFDPDTGEIKEKLDTSKLELLGSAEAAAVAASLSSLEVLKVDKRRQRRQPPAPFITSTLQQESSRKLRLGADQTMRAAQALYEAGYITYMRTDRPTLSREAAGVAERAVRESFGDEYVRKGDAKVVRVRGSQEAHEAIRPALVGVSSEGEETEEGGGDKDVAKTAGEEGAGAGAGSAFAGKFLHPSELPLDGLEDQQRALYELVYRRTLASAMAESEADFTTVKLGVADGGGVSLGGDKDEMVDVVFKATGKTTVFEGFLKAYTEGTDEALPAGAAEEDGQETELPVMVEGGKVVCEEARPAPHRTSPPRRYSEASFIKELEAQGVGRPSTYASIIGTLRTRTYVNMQGRSLTPSLTGFVVADLLREHFPDFTDTGFTAKMEEKLDAIARGEKGRVEYLSEYYLGEEGLKAKVASKREVIDPVEAKRARLPGLESLDNRVSILVGPYGGYLVPEDDSSSSGTGTQDVNVAEQQQQEEGGEEEGQGEVGGEKKSAAVTLPYVAQDNLELLTVDLVERCLDSTYKGGDLLGQHPDTGEDIRIRMGRYGPFLECGDLKVSASAHISTANKKDPTDLSMPSQPTPAELLQQQQQQQGQRPQPQGGSSAGGNAALGTPPDVVRSNDTVVYSAEDVIAFGLGGNSSSGDSGGAGGDDAAVPGSSSGGGTWYSAVSLERAVGLLSLPRVVCESHPAEGGPIEVGVGRFGVWVKHKESYKNVPAGIDVLDVDEELAVQLTDEMIQRNKDRPTVEIGILEGEKVFVKYGKYGRCISCGGTVAVLPQQYKKTKSNPAPEEIPLAEAIELVLEKRAKDSPATAKAGAKMVGGKGAAAAAGKKKKKGRTAGSTNPGQKRPLSAFFRFCKDSREVHTAAAAATAGGAAATSLSSETLSGRWKALPEEERQVFNAAASAALDQWKADNLKSQNGGNGSGGGSSNGGGGGSVARIPQPKNAYIIFSSERRPVLKEEVGGGLTFGEVTKKLAQEWRELEGSSVREEYARRAALLKEAWLKEKEEAAAALRGPPVWVGGGVGGGVKKKKAVAAETGKIEAGAVTAA